MKIHSLMFAPYLFMENLQFSHEVGQTMQDIVTEKTSNDNSKFSQSPSLDSLMRTTFAKFRRGRFFPISGTAKYARYAVNLLNKVEGLQATVREGAATVTTEPSTVPFAPLLGLN